MPRRIKNIIRFSYFRRCSTRCVYLLLQSVLEFCCVCAVLFFLVIFEVNAYVFFLILLLLLFFLQLTSSLCIVMYARNGPPLSGWPLIFGHHFTNFKFSMYERNAKQTNKINSNSRNFDVGTINSSSALTLARNPRSEVVAIRISKEWNSLQLSLV